MWSIVRTAKCGDYLFAVVPEHPNRYDFDYVLYHRVVMENHLGRLLGPDEVVHHKNGNTHDNSIENLEVMSKSDHAKLHAAERPGAVMLSLTCPQCGIGFSRARRQVIWKKSKTFSCSRRCSAQLTRNARKNK